jgi:F-type H+-transporting ATPase subunit a
MADPIHQFELKTIASLGKIGGSELAFTNSSLYMLGAVGLITLFMLWGTSSRAIVPGRFQSMVELCYEFVADTVRSSAGKEGMIFFPFVFSLFMFILVLNLAGMMPYGFTVTSHIIITAAMSLLVIGTVVVYGFMKHGLKFFDLIVPKGVHPPMLAILVPIEVISFVSRPISLSVRLFANMLAGHIALKIFAGFIVSLLAAGAWGILSPLPLALTVALTALEMVVAVLQAYVFATLTSLYLHDALHPGH